MTESTRFLLWGLQSPINIGMILRVAETFGIEVSILDTHQVLRDDTCKTTIGDYACGALQRHPPHLVADLASFAETIGMDRLVATTVVSDAVALPDFVWREGDVIALGNEYDGLPAELVREAAVRLRIPMPDGCLPKPRPQHPIDPRRAAPVARDGTPSLNVAVSAGIIAYSAYFWHRERPFCSRPPVAFG
jgi:tRNA G18 (ribose-2'-O)-methylase SpoU